MCALLINRDHNSSIRFPVHKRVKHHDFPFLFSFHCRLNHRLDGFNVLRELIKTVLLNYHEGIIHVLAPKGWLNRYSADGKFFKPLHKEICRQTA